MENTYQYLILGGGLAGAHAIEGIRQVDVEGTIGLLSAEDRLPYLRPDLTKHLLWGKKTFDQIAIFDEAYYRKQKASIYLKTKATRVDTTGSFVLDEAGNRYHYSKLLIATGGSPHPMPGAEGLVHYYRTSQDYLDLVKDFPRTQDYLVVGGGFIGAELAAGLIHQGKKVSILMRGTQLLSNVFPSDLSDFVTNFYRQKGVSLITGDEPESFSRRGEKVEVRTKNGKTLEFGWVTAGIGLDLENKLAQSAGLKTGNGILVDEYLETSRPGIFAAGDLAHFPCCILGESVRVEHRDNAEAQGRVAGANMAGAKKPYDYLPFFYSDLFELGFEAVGKLDSRMETHAVWDEPLRKGIVAYLEGGKIKGLLLWNKWERVDWARKIITSQSVPGGVPQLEKLLRE
jgi:3-phenylpropionate/trans-cinnamate dioxygenase ferredoxin reductase component